MLVKQLLPLNWLFCPISHSSKSVHQTTWLDSLNQRNVCRFERSSTMHIAHHWVALLSTTLNVCWITVRSVQDTRIWHCKHCLFCWRNNRQKVVNYWFCARAAEGISFCFKWNSTDETVFSFFEFADKCWKTWKCYRHSLPFCMFQICHNPITFSLCLRKVNYSTNKIQLH